MFGVEPTLWQIVPITSIAKENEVVFVVPGAQNNVLYESWWVETRAIPCKELKTNHSIASWPEKFGQAGWNIIPSEAVRSVPRKGYGPAIRFFAEWQGFDIRSPHFAKFLTEGRVQIPPNGAPAHVLGPPASTTARSIELEVFGLKPRGQSLDVCVNFLVRLRYQSETAWRTHRLRR